MLNRVVAENFQSFKNLSFTVPTGATLIDGWNEDDQTSEGAGKSAVLNAISWCLFGKIPKDANIDEVIKRGEDSCRVELHFSNGDTVVRTRNPNDLYITKISDQHNQIKGIDAKDTVRLIEEYIGCNFETFCQSTYFAQNYTKKFLSSNQEDKGKILSSIQNLQIFDKARKEASDLLKLENDKQLSLNHQLQIEKTNVSNLETQKDMIESFVKEKIENHKKQVDYLNMQITQMNISASSQINKLTEVCNAYNIIDLEALSKEETDLKCHRQNCYESLNKVTFEKSQLDVTKRLILSKELEGKNLAQKYESLQVKKQAPLELHHTHVRLYSELKRLSQLKESSPYIRLISKQSDLLKYRENPNKNCPTCGQEMKVIDLSHVDQELLSIDRDLSALITNNAQDLERVSSEVLSFETQFKKDLESVDVECGSIISQLQAISEYLDQNKMPSIEDLSSMENSCRKTLYDLDESLSNIQSKRLLKSKYENEANSLNNSLNQLKFQIEQSQSSLSTLGEPDVLNDLSKVTVLQNQVSELHLKIGQMEMLLGQTQAHASRLESLKDGFKEIKSFVFVNALNELNYRTNQYLNELFEVEASIKFVSEDQKIECKVTLDGHETSLGLLSGGQNRRFNLAVDLALADIVSYRKTSKLDILILDEYFKDLSEQSMEKCLNLLKSRKCPVLLIEHNTIFKNIVDNTFFVRLENGTSYHE